MGLLQSNPLSRGIVENYWINQGLPNVNLWGHEVSFYFIYLLCLN